MTVPPPLRTSDRRTFLAEVLAAPLLRAPATPRARRGQGRLALADVLAGAHALLASHMTGTEANDEAWVHGATALLARLDPLPPDPFGAMTERERAFLRERGWTFRRADGVPADGARPAVITHQIHVPPDGKIPLHDHRELFGAIVVAAGEVEIRSYDVVDGDAATTHVTLQETNRAWLRPGRFSLLTRTRDNVHELHAGKDGARVLDLFAWLGPASRSHDLAWVDDTAPTATGRRRRACWV